LDVKSSVFANLSILFSNDNLSSGALETSPSLGIVVSQLKGNVEHYNREKQTYEDLLRQRNSLPSLSLDSNVQTQHQTLTKRLADKQAELKLAVLVTEHCLFLLWAHLDYFMLRSIPVNPLHFAHNSTYFNNEPTPLEIGWKTTAEDIGAMKKTLVAVFNETFCKQLVNTAATQASADRGFVESMLRRIKRLIQFVPVK
jgi:nuclear pore complex protein Nup205